MVLIEVRKRDGTVVGRCDARCYNARGGNCSCICGGANHGAGLDRAMDNTSAMVETWIEDFAKRHNLDEYESRVAPLQMRMFDGRDNNGHSIV